MSDGRTDAYRSMRKSTYLESIELEKDTLMDEYMKLTDELITITNSIVDDATIRKTWFGRKPDYKLIEKSKIKYIEIKTKLGEKEKIIEQLDRDFKETLEKPLKEF